MTALEQALQKLRWLARAPSGGRCDFSPDEGAALLRHVAELERMLDARIDSEAGPVAVVGLPDSTRSGHSQITAGADGPTEAA